MAVKIECVPRGVTASKNALRVAVRQLAQKSAKSWFESVDYADAEGVKEVKKRVVSSLVNVKPFLPDYGMVVRGAGTK